MPVMRAVADHAARGGAVLGVCNGFQILLEAGLLPGALMRNASLKFVCREVKLEVVNADTAFTRVTAKGQIIRCPVAHHDGNYFADAETLARIEGEGQVVFRYAEGTNPNGSINDIAGIVNEKGNVLGIMPHPENLIEDAHGGMTAAELVAAHGLKPDEYQRILDLIGREPTLHRARHLLGHVERALLLQILEEMAAHPADQGRPGDPGAGRECRRGRHRRRPGVVFKMESHNHPSYIEPYQGAATGVGGILRDVFTMGARPIAAMNALRFGEPDHPKTRIWSPAWSPASAATAIPSACRRSAARSSSTPATTATCLVNALAAGLAEADKIFYSKAKASACRSSISAPRPARRHRRRDHGLGRVRRPDRGEAPDRAGRRSLHREAACWKPASN
jgi:hypothetical protein